MPQSRWVTGGLAAALCITLTSACGNARELSDDDRTAIRALDAAYVDAWLADDTAGVLATLAPDAILMPAGARPLQGDSAIRRFWWPNDGSATRVTAYETTVDEIDGSDSLAFARGTGALTFVYEKDTTRIEQTSRNMTLTIVMKQADGTWRIHRRMWGALAP